MSDTDLFAFEQDFVDSLRCIPMAVGTLGCRGCDQSLPERYGLQP